jgi:hypothetical protein
MDLESSESVETLYTILVDPSAGWIEKNKAKNLLQKHIQKDPVNCLLIQNCFSYMNMSSLTVFQRYVILRPLKMKVRL